MRPAIAGVGRRWVDSSSKLIGCHGINEKYANLKKEIKNDLSSYRDKYNKE